MRGAASRAVSSEYRPHVLEFRILGPLEVVADDRPLPLRAPRQRSTLAILLLGANRVVSVDRLADDLYAGAAPLTAVKQVQRQISDLRKALGAGARIETRPPGYVLRATPEQLDLHRFEQLAETAARALEAEEPGRAAELFRDALALWRGAPLGDLAHEPFAQPAIARLEELRVAVIEQRIEADLRLGRHTELIAELEQLVAEEPLRERLRGQLMLALYRAGRQADALGVYRRGRDALVEELGVEPTPGLRELERSILAQDPALELDRPPAAPARTVLVAPSDDSRLDELLEVAERLARLPGRELLIASLVRDETEVARAAAALEQRRSSLRVASRGAAFTAADPAREIVRLARTYEVDVVLVDVPPAFASESLPAVLAAVLERSPADVAALAGSVEWGGGSGVFVPFGGGEHDWAALELAAWLASAVRLPLRLVGTGAAPDVARRDASRLLADASLAVQRVVGIDARPHLVEPSEEALVEAVDGATLVVVGMSPRWRAAGIGAARRALLSAGRAPVILVHKGVRPGGLAPRDSRSRFTWSLEPR